MDLGATKPQGPFFLKKAYPLPVREVNIIIADFNDDFCTLRRDMVAEKLLVREKNQYRKL